MPIGGVRSQWRSTLRRWWKIDVLTLGLGAFFAWIAWRRLPDNASFADALLPNFASELFGVWLGVRIIDYLISNNEEHHRVRRNVLNVIESTAELSRKILIKFDVVFLEEFRSRRALAERIYRNKTRRFSADELEDFAGWLERGSEFEAAARTYFRQVSDLKTVQGALPGALGEQAEKAARLQAEEKTLVLSAERSPYELLSVAATNRFLDEPWASKLANTLDDFVHHHGRPSIVSGPNSIGSLLREAEKRLAGINPAVRQILDGWFIEIRQLIGLRIEFDAAFEEFSYVCEKLTTNILEETDE